jgi:hypothetical protein
MRLLLSLYAALVSAAPAAPAAPATPVAVGTVEGDLGRLPRLESRGQDHLNSDVMTRLHQIASKGECILPGYSAGRLDFQLPFAARFEAGGSLSRIVLPKLNCPEAEGIIGGALIEMVRGGDYRPSGKSQDGWYRGQLNFVFVG